MVQRGARAGTQADDHPMMGHPGYQCDHIDYCMEIINHVGSKSLGLLFDIYHVQIMDGEERGRYVLHLLHHQQWQQGGNKVARKAEDGRNLRRDFHGGGYHGGWGGASRMRIYEELSRQKMLTAAEEALFRKLV